MLNFIDILKNNKYRPIGCMLVRRYIGHIKPILTYLQCASI